MKSYARILDEVLQESKCKLDSENLKDAFEFYTEIRHLYYKKAVKYLIDTVIPYLLLGTPSLKMEGATKTSYNLIKSKLTLNGWNRTTSIQEVLGSLKNDLEFKLTSYVSDPMNLVLSEKVHSLFLEKCAIPYQKLKSKESKSLYSGKYSVDFLIKNHYLCTCKILQGTGGSDTYPTREFKQVIEDFARYSINNANPVYKRLIIILDYPTQNLKHSTEDWVRSFKKKEELVKEVLPREAGTHYNKTVFIGRFKDLFNQGAFY